MQKIKVSYVGSRMTTFSGSAYWEMAHLFGGPLDSDSEEVSASVNEEVLTLVIGHGGFGAIAMETLAEGRVEGPVTSFLKLLGCHQTTADCPIAVAGAIVKPLNFALMVRPGVRAQDINAVVAHIKSKGACMKRITGIRFIESGNNGQAAQDVATKPEFAQAAALGPRSAAKEYGLEVLEDACEDKPAITTFFLLAPKTHATQLGEINRSLLVCRFKNESGTLVKVLTPFADAGLNLRHGRDYYTGNGQYDWVFQFDCRKDQIEDHSQAMSKASRHMERHILFGPFPVMHG